MSDPKSKPKVAKSASDNLADAVVAVKRAKAVVSALQDDLNRGRAELARQKEAMDDEYQPKRDKAVAALREAERMLAARQKQFEAEAEKRA
jgi:hypothetical protein